MDPVEHRVRSVLSDNGFIRKWDRGTDKVSDGLFDVLVQAVLWAEPHYQQILRLFPEYTPHDFTVHSLNILDTLDWLVPEDVASHLSHWDIFFIIAASILHDIGMGPSPEATAEIRESGPFQELHSRVREQTLEPISDEAVLRLYVRQHHHTISAALIRSFFRDIDRGAGEVVALIAEAHGCAVTTIASDPKYSKTFAFRLGATADIPYLSVIVRMADLFDATRYRARLRLYQFLQPMATESDLEWGRQQATLGIARHPTRTGVITVSAVCTNPEAYHELRKHAGYVNQEVRDVVAYLSARPDVPDLEIRSIEFDIRTEGFLRKEWKFELSPSGIVQLLMGDRLYSDAVVAIRELVQNSIDAVRQMAKISPRDYQPKIEVSLELVGDRYLLTIKDNGIGMDEHVVEEFFLRIGRPYYQSAEYRLKYEPRQRIEPIGQFGVGFVSVFMLAEQVSVDTLKGGAKPIRFEMTDVMEYLVATESNRTIPGTTVELVLKAGMAVRKTAKLDEPGTQIRTVRPMEVEAGGVLYQPSWQDSPLRGSWSPVLLSYRDTSDQFRVKHGQRKVSVLSLEACLDVFIGYLEFPIYYKELWEEDYSEFWRARREPPVDSIVIAADADRDHGLSGCVVLSPPMGWLGQSIVSQNGMRIRVLENARLLPRWCSLHYMELDLSGSARVDVLASREEVSNKSVAQLTHRIDDLIRRGIGDEFDLLRSQVGASQATVSIAWRFFWRQLAHLMRGMASPLPGPEDTVDPSIWLAGYLPLVADMPDGRRVVTLSEVRETGAKLRLVFTASEGAVLRDPGVVQVFVAPDAALFFSMVYGLRSGVSDQWEIVDTASGILMESELAVVHGSGIPLARGATKSYEVRMMVPRLLLGSLVNSKLVVQRLSCLGSPTYVLNSNHRAMRDFRNAGSEYDFLSPLVKDRWSQILRSGPDFVDGVNEVLGALDTLSGLKQSVASSDQLIDSLNKGLDTLHHRISGKRAARVRAEDLPPSWVIP